MAGFLVVSFGCVILQLKAHRVSRRTKFIDGRSPLA
jgi:hypothetical protein